MEVGQSPIWGCSAKGKKIVSVSVSYDNILMWMCEILTILHEGKILRMNIFAFYS
jgi:hypothetical protein